jgi:hypothetical protein
MFGSGLPSEAGSATSGAWWGAFTVTLTMLFDGRLMSSASRSAFAQALVGGRGRPARLVRMYHC